MSRELTSKQNRFCENIALEGMNQTEAYRDAYDCENMLEKSIREKASELASKVNISSTIKELRNQETQATIKEIAYTRSQSFKVFDDNIKVLKERLEDVRKDRKLSLKDKIYLENMLLKNIREQEEQKAKLWSLFIDKKEIGVKRLEDILDEIE